MIVLLSPAKRQAGASDAPVAACGQEREPRFASQAQRLRERLAALSKEELRRIFSLSERRAQEVYDLYHRESLPREAIDLFRGPAFASLTAGGVPEALCRGLGDGLRILSGLYGYLHPFDTITPYRLDLEDKLPGAGNLTRFWRPRVTEAILAEPSVERERVIVDLASREYGALIDEEAVARAEVRLIRPEFYTLRDGMRKRISVHAKQGRGGLARLLLLHRGDRGEGARRTPAETLLAEARWDGYSIDSGEPGFVFLKQEPA